MSFDQIPSPEGENFPIPIYSASSIVAMKEGKSEIIEARKRQIANMKQPLRGLVRATELPDRGLAKIRGKEYNPATGAIITIPIVRHFPKEDRNGKLVLSDPTASCEVALPPFSMRKLLQIAGLDMNWENVAKLDWAGDVYLLNQYFTNNPDRSILIRVNNRSLTDTTTEDVGIEVVRRKLAAVAAGARTQLHSPEGYMPPTSRR